MPGLDSGTVSAAALLASGDIAGGSLAVGPGGTSLTLIAAYAPSLAPVPVAAATAAEQTFTVTGLATSDTVLVNGPAPASGCPLVHARVSALNTLALTFLNPSAGALTPDAGTYRVIAIRS